MAFDRRIAKTVDDGAGSAIALLMPLFKSKKGY